MGLLRGVARTAVVAGTATAVSNRVSRRQAGRWAAREERAAPPPQDYPPQQAYAAPPPPEPAPGAADADLARLQQLGELRASGVLTEAEFQVAEGPHPRPLRPPRPREALAPSGVREATWPKERTCRHTKQAMSVRGARSSAWAPWSAPASSLLGEAGAVAGSAVWLSFLLGGVVAGLLGYVVAQLGAAYPVGGGLITYLVKGYGPGHVSAVVWLLYFAASS